MSLGAAQSASAQFLTFRNFGSVTSNSYIEFKYVGGQVYYADSAANQVGRFDPNTGAVTVIAGATGLYGSTDGHVSVARLSGPSGIAVDDSGNIYVAESHKIRRISVDGYVTTVAGSPSNYCGSADGNGTAATFCAPKSLAFDNAGNLWVADTSNNRIRKIAPNGDVTTVAGSSTSGTADGSGTSARFDFPISIAFNGSDAFYVADQNNSTIRKVTLDGSVTTLAGLGRSNGNLDGTGSGARFYYPTAVSVIPDTGDLFVSDSWNYALRRVTPAGVVTTAGGIVGGPGSAEGTGYWAQFDRPRGVAAIDAHTAFVGDNAGTVKKGTRSIADEAKIDATSGTVGVARQLSVLPLTADTFSWSVVVRPAGSIATFSDPTFSNPTFTPDMEGNYTIRLDASSSAGTSITYVYLTANCVSRPPAPTVTRISGNDPSCPGQTIVLQASAGYDSYKWQSGLTVYSTTNMLTAAPTFSTSWSVSGTLNGCSNSQSYSHTVITQPTGNPTVILNGNDVVCANGNGTSEGTFTLYPNSYSSSGYARQWGYRTVTNGPITPIPGETGSSYAIDPLDFPAPGTYRMVCTITPSCGFSPVVSQERAVTLRTPVNASISASAMSACASTPVQITATGSGGIGPLYDIWIVQRTPNDVTLKLCSSSASCTTTGYPGRSYYAVVWQSGVCMATSNDIAIDTYPTPAPIATSTGSTCDGMQMIVSNPNPTSTYVWSNGATGTSMTPATSGSYRVTETTINGCSAVSNYSSVTQNIPPVATITPGGPTTFCAGGSVTLTSTQADAYRWSNGATTRSINVTQGGSYTVEITYFQFCKRTSAPTVVTVNALPTTPVITPSGPTNFCEGGSVVLSAPEGFSYLWSNGATTQSIEVNTSGSFTVQTTNANGCNATSAPTLVTVSAYPDATVTANGPTQFCEGGSVALTAPAGNTYLWSNGATTQSIAATQSGDYSVVVTNSGGCATTSAPVSVTVDPLPGATIAASGPTTFCVGGAVTLTAPSGSSYAWSNGATSQSIAVGTSGTYGVTVTSSAGCTRAATPVVVAVHPYPLAGIQSFQLYDDGGFGTMSRIGDAIQACGNPTIRLVAQALDPSYSYSWSTGGTTAVINVTSSGTYTLTVTGPGGCATTSEVSVTYGAIPAKPVIASTSGTELCPAGGSVTLTAPTADAWTWSNGATTQAIVATEPGSYTVRVRNGACESPLSDPVAVTTGISTISANDSLDLCGFGDSVTLTADGGTSWLWSNGATTQSVGVFEAGTYTVITTNEGCTMPESAPAVVTARSASIGANGPTTFCDGGSVTLTASAGTSWLWSNGATTQSITVSESGSYGVNAMFADGCAIPVAPVTVDVRHVAVAIVADRTAICEGSAIELSASASGSSGYTYQWYDNTYAPIAGATSSTLTIHPTTSGFVYVKVHDELGCEATSNSAIYTVAPMPDAVITASGPTTFCDGGSVTLTASAGSSYAWSNGATTPSITVAEAGDYSVTVTNAEGCSTTSSATSITVNALPIASITASGPTTFCVGGSVTLTAGAASSYLWSNGATTQSIAVGDSGDYSVTVTNAEGCNATSAATTVTVNALPIAAITASGPTTFCAGGSVTLTADAASSYLWSNGATTQSIAVSDSGDYSVTVTNENGCNATSSATSVTVNALPIAAIAASGPTTFCAGGSVTLTASAGTSYAWSNGATTQSITVADAGDYSVTITNADGCSATSSATSITVNALPIAAITASGPTTFCAGGSVTLTAGVASSYLWSNGATTQSIDVSDSGDYSVTVTNAEGCDATSSATTVTVNALPIAAITASGPTTFCTGGAVTLTASAGASYAWSNGATTSSITVSDSGEYSVTVTNANGCSATSSATSITVNELPIAAITASGPTTFCAGGSVTLTASAGSSYAWSNGATTQSINAAASGNYSVTVTNANGCSTTSSATTVTVNALPAATISASGPTTFCAGGSVTLTASAGSSYAWSNGATTQSINVTDSGSYSVIVTNANGCSTTSSATNVTVNPLPTPAISADGPTTFCQGGSVTLTATGGYGTWYRDGVAYSAMPSIVINSLGSATFLYRIQTAAGCTADSDPITVTVNPKAVINNTSGFASLCWNATSASHQINNAPAGATFAWTITGGTILSGATNAVVFYAPAPDANNVGLDVTMTNSSGCSTSSHFDIPVNRATPTAITPDGPTTFCTGGSVTLTMPTAPAGWLYYWSNNATTQSITVSASGTYTAYYQKSGCLGPAAEPVTVTVNPLPTATISASGSTTFCAGGSVTLTASSGSSWLWSNGATTQSINATSGGSYSVTVTNANGCSKTSAPTIVTVNALPTATISAGGPTTFCTGGSVTLTASAGSSYLWSNGATTPSINATATGNYSVTVTNASGCSATSSATTVTVNATPATPTITAGGPTTFCTGGSVTLTASAGSSWLWSNGATTPSINVTATGNYSVTVTNASGCSATSSATTVTVNATPATPTITAGGPTTFCVGGSVTLTASAGSSYLWSNGATTQAINVTATGNYSVTVTNASGCSATSSATTVTVNATPATPTITAGGPTTFCAGGSVTLTASVGSSYLWSTGATTQSINATTTGNYSVTVTNASGCSATSSPTAVTVNPSPTATITAGGPTTFCAGGSVTLTASAGSSYLWSNGATTPSINVTTTGNYSVTVTNIAGCSATSSATAVTVNAKPSTPTIAAGGPTTFCAGGSVTLTAPAGFAYLWSNSATTQSINVTASGSYSVTVSNASGCGTASAPTTVTVNAKPTSTISASGPTTFCTGGSVTLSASAGSSYLWSNGATTPSINVTTTGNYSVTVTNIAGCSATSSATAVTVNAKPSTPTITAGGATTFCAGGSVTLTAPAGFTYLWSNGATSQSINATSSGNYTVTITNAGGCSAISAPKSVTVNAATAITAQPLNKSIPKNTTTTLSVTATGTTPISYQWYRGTSPSTATPINGATSSSYTTPKLSHGTYTYWVRVTGGCGVVNSTTATVTSN